MKRLLISFVIMVLMFPNGLHAGENDSLIFLGLHIGLGYGMYCDMGVGEVRYGGMELLSEMSLTVHRGGWRHEVRTPCVAGGYWRQIRAALPESYGLVPGVGYTALRTMWGAGGWRLLAGGGIDEMFDLRYNTTLGNNGVGTSNFLRLNVAGRMEWTSGHKWQLYSQLRLTAASVVMRPGYAYMANYDHTPDNPVKSHFAQHGWAVVCGNAMETATGASLTTRNGNRVTVEYLWHHLTSRTAKACPHRFDSAGHMIRLGLMFAL